MDRYLESLIIFFAFTVQGSSSFNPVTKVATQPDKKFLYRDPYSEDGWRELRFGFLMNAEN